MLSNLGILPFRLLGTCSLWRGNPSRVSNREKGSGGSQGITDLISMWLNNNSNDNNYGEHLLNINHVK